MKKPGKTIPQYVRKLLYLQRIGALPREMGLHLVTVYHDDWCGIYQGKPCNCDPDIRLKAQVPSALN